MTKPFSAGELMARVRTTLDLQRVRREAREPISVANIELNLDLAAMTRLQQLSTRLVQANEFTNLLGEVLEAAIEITRADKGNIQLFQEGVLRIVQQRGFEAPFLNFFKRVEQSEAACGGAPAQAANYCEDVATSPIFNGKPALEVILVAI